MSCRVVRHNKYHWHNTRLLVLTHESFMIMKQKSKNLKEIRLKIPHEEIKGLTVSLHTSSHELVIHLEMQADLRITCVGTREQIIDALKVFYQARKGESLAIYGVR